MSTRKLPPIDEAVYKTIVQSMSDLVNISLPNQQKGFLGYHDTNDEVVIEVPGQANRVYVTTENNRIECINMGVPLEDDLPVIVEFPPQQTPIVRQPDIARAIAFLGSAAKSVGFTAAHTHRLDSGMPYVVQGLLVEPGLVVPDTVAGGLSLRVLPGYVYEHNGKRYRLPETTKTPTMPASANEHRWTVAGVDKSATPHSLSFVYGSAQSTALPLVEEDLFAIALPETFEPMMGVRSTNGQTAYNYATQFVDMRPWGRHGLGASQSTGVIYVAAWGDDNFKGLTPARPKRSITAGLTAAASGSTNGTGSAPGTSNWIVVRVLDAGIYEEKITIPSYVIVQAETATLTDDDGILVTVDDAQSYGYFGRLENTQTGGNTSNATCVSKGGTGLSMVYAREIIPGEGGAAFVNTTTNAQLFARWEKMVLPDDSYGCLAASGGNGHFHIMGGDSYFNGDNISVLAAFGSVGLGGTIVGSIEHVLSISGSSGRRVIYGAGSNTDPRIDVQIDEIGEGADVAIDLDFGILTLQCGRMVGDVDIESGASAYVDVAQHVSGSVSNDGTLVGRIDDTWHGMAPLSTDQGGTGVDNATGADGEILVRDGVDGVFVPSPSIFEIAGSFGIGTSPDGSAVFHAQSTTKGALLPRMTEAQRDAIGTPADGLIVYNTDTGELNFYDSSSWQPVGYWSQSGSDIYYDAGGVKIGASGTTTANLESSSPSSGDNILVRGASAYSWIRFIESTTTRGYLGYGDGGQILTGAGTDSVSLRSEGYLHLAGGGNRLIMTLTNGTIPQVMIGYQNTNPVSAGNGQLEVIAPSSYWAGAFYRQSNVVTNAIATFFSDVTATETLHCVINNDGDLENTNNRYTGFSDRKHKRRIRDARTNYLDDLMKIRIRKYDNMLAGGAEHIGIVAQELEPIFPGLVGESLDPMYRGDNIEEAPRIKSVAYSVLNVIALAGLQEMKREYDAKVSELESRLAALEGA